MRTITTIVSLGACLAVALTTGACGAEPSSQSPAPTVTVTAPASTQPTQPPATEPAPAPNEESAQWTMPNLVGANLQDAQDQIQALTGDAVFFTDSQDLTGQDRQQVLDRNWQVCTQNLAPGAPVTSTSRIDFGVVKLEESCP